MLPKESLEHDYIVATHCEKWNCVLLVLAAQDGADVRVKLRVSEGSEAEFDGVSYPDGGEIRRR